MAILASCNSSAPDNNGTSTVNLRWKKLGQLPGNNVQSRHPGLAGPVAGIQDDYLILGGGSNFAQRMPWEGGSKKYYSQLYIYRLNEHPDTAMLLTAQAALPYAVGYPACVSTDKGLVVAGGENETGLTANVLLITMDKTRQRPVITELPALPKATSGGMAGCLGDMVYFAGGNTAGGTSSQFLALNLKKTEYGWQKLPELPQPTCMGVLYSNPASSEIYIAGGRKINRHARTSFFKSVFAYHTPETAWHKKADLPYAVSAATGIRSGNKLLLFGGDKGHTFHQTEDLLIQISDTKDSQAKSVLTAQKDTLQKTHPGFTRQVLAYDLATDKWDLTGQLFFESQVTTVAIPWGDKVIIPCGEIRAGVRYPDIIEGTIRHLE